MHQMQHLRSKPLLRATPRLGAFRWPTAGVRQLHQRQPERHQQRHLPGQQQQEGEQDDGRPRPDDRAEQGLDRVGARQDSLEMMLSSVRAAAGRTGTDPQSRSDSALRIV